MYELVNTSLPNGLIAGTHGFSTVAMTKGLPDILRGRLETLCAYTHRTSAHGPSYYKENPVNWFHLTLPQGEHVVGRVAPAEFDYTGRTNRLARLRIFNAREMPDTGGAAILVKEKDWFEQPWTGEPRFLENDESTSKRLKLDEPKRSSSAPAWISLFGDKGQEYAVRIASQIERNIAAGGRTIYFKTSTEWDPSGEKLLSLFAEVIGLLPVALHQKVTFSTYPVSLAGNIACHLKGVYDKDKAFDVASATQAWVDCVNAKVVHPEMLPKIDAPQTTQSASSRTISYPVEGMSNGESGASAKSGGLGLRHGQASSGDPNSYSNLIAPKKAGPDMFVVGLVAAALIVILAAVAFFFWMMHENRMQMEASGANIEEQGNHEWSENDKVEHITEYTGVPEAVKSGQEHKTGEKPKQDTKIGLNREVAKATAKIEKERAAQEAKAREEREAKEREEYKKKKYSFKDGHIEGEGKPPEPQTRRKSKSSGDCTFLVFYYVDGGCTLTNEVAGFAPKSAPGNKSKITDYRLYVRSPENKDLTMLDNSPVVIWMWGDKVWYDWSRHEKKKKKNKWFEKSDSRDLQNEFFGGDDEVFPTWNAARPVTYYVSWGEGKGEGVDWEKRAFTFEDAIRKIYPEVGPFYAAVTNVQKKIEENKKKIEDVKNELQKITGKIETYNTATNELAEISGEIESLKEDKNDNTAKLKELETKKTSKEAEIKEIKEIDTIIKDKKSKEDKIESLQKKANELNDELNKEQKKYNSELHDPKREKPVRDRFFSVEIKRVNQ